MEIVEKTITIFYETYLKNYTIIDINDNCRDNYHCTDNTVETNNIVEDVINIMFYNYIKLSINFEKI